MTTLPATTLSPRGPEQHENYAIRGLLLLLAACSFAVWMSGCAAGRGPGGEVVVGWDVAKLPESAGELFAAGASFLPPPFNYLVTGAATLLLGGGAAAVGRSRYRKDTDKAWDEALAEARREDAERDRAWDEAAHRSGERDSLAAVVAALGAGIGARPVPAVAGGAPPAAADPAVAPAVAS